MKILLVQRSLNPPGGGNAVAAWMLHALARDHELSTITLSPWDEARTNVFYGTSIPEGRVRKHLVPASWRWLATLPENRLGRLRMSAVERSAARIGSSHDLLITADNFAAFPKPGVHYLHYPEAFTGAGRSLAGRAYFTLCDRVAGVRRSEARHNVSIASSTYTARQLMQVQGIHAAHVLYPPVLDPGEGLPWASRSNTFLCIGRFNGSKRFEVAISIVRRVRATSIPGARLTIIGSPVDRDYTRRLHRFAARDRHWIEFRENLPRAELNALMGRCRFGLHAMEGEHFGMATAEMLRAGCLVFPDRSGGSIEVVAQDDRLLWATEDEAVRKIGAIARDAVARDEVRWKMRHHTRAFSPERFVEQMRAIAESAYVSLRNDSSAISS